MTWDRLRKLPPFFAATIAVVAALISAAAWVTGYFATQQQLERVECYSNANEELLARQVEAANAYANYINYKMKLSDLRDAGSDSTEAGREQMEELQVLKKREWERLHEWKAKADQISSLIEANRECK